VARRARRLFRGGRVVDLGAGHGLLAQIMLILDDTSPAAVAVDVRLPASCAKLHAALVESWPRLRDRIAFADSAGLDSVGSRRCGGVESCLRRAHGCRARARRGGARPRGGAAVLPPCRWRQRSRVARPVGLGRRRTRHRPQARGAPRAAGLPRVDADHPCQRDTEEQVAAGSIWLLARRPGGTLSPRLTSGLAETRLRLSSRVAR
jgi:hypothetical protein